MSSQGTTSRRRGATCTAAADTDAASPKTNRAGNAGSHSAPNKKHKPLTKDDENAAAASSLSMLPVLPDLVLDEILSYCSLVEMVRLCLTSKTGQQDWAPSAERVASAIVQAERDQIYWGLLLYSSYGSDRRSQRCFEYGEGPKLRRLYELEKSTMESFHFPTLEGAAQFVRAGQGRRTMAELHCPNRSAMMHDSMGGLVQAVGGRTKDKLKFVQTKKTSSILAEQQHRFVVKIIYRDGSIGGRDNIFLGVVNEKYEPPYRSRDASRHKKSVNNGRFILLPRARKDRGERTVVVGLTLDMKTKELILEYPNSEDGATTRTGFAQLRGEEFRLAFRQEKYNPQDDFYGVVDIAMRELDQKDYERLMADERATRGVRVAAALAAVKRGELVEMMKRIVGVSRVAGIADTPVEGMTIGRTAAMKEWYVKPAELNTLDPVDPSERFPKFYLAEVIGVDFKRYNFWHFEQRIRSHPNQMKLFSRYLLEKFEEYCAEIEDGNIIEEAYDIVEKTFDVKMRSECRDMKVSAQKVGDSEDEEDLLLLRRRIDAFERIKNTVMKRLTE